MSTPIINMKNTITGFKSRIPVACGTIAQILTSPSEKNGMSIEEAKDLTNFVMDRDSRVKQVRAISAWAIFVKEEHRMNRVPPEMNTTHLQVQGVEFIGMAYNRFKIGAGATDIVGTGKGLEYVHTVLNSCGLGLDGFAAFHKGQLLDQRKAVLKNMWNIPGLELFVSRIVGDSEPAGAEATKGEAAADENAGAAHVIRKRNYFLKAWDNQQSDELNECFRSGGAKEILDRWLSRAVERNGVDFETVVGLVDKAMELEAKVLVREKSVLTYSGSEHGGNTLGGSAMSSFEANEGLCNGECSDYLAVIFSACLWKDEEEQCRDHGIRFNPAVDEL
ncbi:hypothetical protein EV426DRAFT_709413 [Tirmania nivea]|nr:hypothetical protein EV426DRAFT_709413 [Tirmania nivea]